MRWPGLWIRYIRARRELLEQLPPIKVEVVVTYRVRFPVGWKGRRRGRTPAAIIESRCLTFTDQVEQPFVQDECIKLAKDAFRDFACWYASAYQLAIAGKLRRGDLAGAEAFTRDLWALQRFVEELEMVSVGLRGVMLKWEARRVSWEMFVEATRWAMRYSRNCERLWFPAIPYYIVFNLLWVEERGWPRLRTVWIAPIYYWDFGQYTVGYGWGPTIQAEYIKECVPWGREFPLAEMPEQIVAPVGWYRCLATVVQRPFEWRVGEPDDLIANAKALDTYFTLDYDYKEDPSQYDKMLKALAWLEGAKRAGLVKHYETYETGKGAHIVVYLNRPVNIYAIRRFLGDDIDRMVMDIQRWFVSRIHDTLFNAKYWTDSRRYASRETPIRNPLFAEDWCSKCFNRSHYDN